MVQTTVTGASVATASPRPLRPWQVYVLAFLASGCSLVIELVAGRIMAPILGVSLYTWTSIIGVVLAGISLGNFLGGKLADRFASRRTLGILLLLGGLAALSVLLTAGEVVAHRPPTSLPLLAQIVLLTAGIFFIPSCLLGTISPLLVKLTLRDLAQSGNVVGKISAVATAGSIVGTFATGFYLISAFGTRTVMLGVGLALFLLAIVYGDWSWRRRGALVVPLLLLVGTGATGYMAANRGLLKSDCVAETNYYCIKVYDQSSGSDTLRVLVLDHLVHSFNSLDNPQRLEYGYEFVYAALTEYSAGLRSPGELRTLFIGGGGYTFPRYVESRFAGSTIDVIEIDPEVTRVAGEKLGLNPAGSIRTVNMDARLAFEQMPAGQVYDLVLGDAFNGYSVPYHLTTLEFDERIRQHLSPQGIYMLNIIDGRSGIFARSTARTLRAVFPYVAALPVIENYQDQVRNTWVLIGSNTPLDRDAYLAAAARTPRPDIAAHVWDGAKLDEFLANGDSILITDDYAPVDNLLAPLFEESGF